MVRPDRPRLVVSVRPIHVSSRSGSLINDSHGRSSTSKTTESAESSSFIVSLYVTNRNLNVIGIYVLTYCCEMAREAPS